MYVNQISKSSQIQFSEPEAARMLGVSIDQLRSLVQGLVAQDEGSAGATMNTYQQTDLILLRILAQTPRAANVVRT
jgi:hypothetical protein